MPAYMHNLLGCCVIGLHALIIGFAALWVRFSKSERDDVRAEAGKRSAKLGANWERTYNDLKRENAKERAAMAAEIATLKRTIDAKDAEIARMEKLMAATRADGVRGVLKK